MSLRTLTIAACIWIACAAALSAQPSPTPPPSNEDCAACHGDATASRANGTSVAVDMAIHTASRHGEMACVDCHTDLAAQAEYPHAEKLAAVSCASCHGDVGVTYDDSIHARARQRSGLTVAPTCSNCHGSHDIRATTDPKSRVAHTQVPATCGTCHEGITLRYAKGVHAAALQRADLHAPSCATCHTAHAIQRMDTEVARLGVTAECGTCHLSVVESYGRTFHGKVTQLGGASVAACADCHGAHEIRPAADPASTVSPHQLAATCGKCHAGANARFVEYDPHPNPNDYQRGRVLWWVNRFYRVLIPACFGFFGLHSLLWFWRARREARARTGVS